MPKLQVLERYPHPKHPRLSVQRKSNSRFYVCVTYLDGKLRQKSTKTTHLPTAFKLSEDWYKRELRASVTFGRQHPIERLTTDPTIAEIYVAYLGELDSKKKDYAEQTWSPLAEFWHARLLSTVDTATFKEFYAWRRKNVKGITNHTLHKNVVLIRQILKHALNEGLLTQLPHIPPVGKITKNPRPWLTPHELAILIAVAEHRVKNAPNVRVAGQRQDCLDLILFLCASMMRIGEIRALRFRDCRVEKNVDGDKMLLCEVTGKRGTRTVVAHRDAVRVFERRLKSYKCALQDLEHGETLDDRVFPSHSRDAFRELLLEAGLREAHGFERNLKSLRATSISTQLLRDPDLNLGVVARNAGTSIAMIDQFYAKRLTAEMHKDRLSRLPEHLSERRKKKKPTKTEQPPA